MPSNDSQVKSLAIAFSELAKTLVTNEVVQGTRLAAGLETEVKSGEQFVVLLEVN